MFVQCRHGNGGYGVSTCLKQKCKGLYFGALGRFSRTDTKMSATLCIAHLNLIQTLAFVDSRYSIHRPV